jgi:predicted amino acid dehydrogenase
VIVGAGPTGGTVSSLRVDADAIVVDVAIPGTLVGAIPPGVTVLAGEAVSFPDNWNRGFWGWLYHVLSGYGPNQVFACLIEPLVLAVMGRQTPYSIGRTLHAADVEAFGVSARSLGFQPRLAQGWRGVALDEILPVGLLNESR